MPGDIICPAPQLLISLPIDITERYHPDESKTSQMVIYNRSELMGVDVLHPRGV
jgi:hypothetical protein